MILTLFTLGYYSTISSVTLEQNRKKKKSDDLGITNLKMVKNFHLCWKHARMAIKFLHAPVHVTSNVKVHR